MAESKIKRNNSNYIIKEVTCTGDGTNGIHSFSITQVSGYTPVGIVGYFCVGGYEAARGIYQARIDGNNLNIGWENAIPSNRQIVYRILYCAT